MTVALQNCMMNLKQLAFDITLIYDIPDYGKEVAYVSTKPVDYKPCINDIGDEISFDAKISALSSQHEDSFFRLKITVWDPNNLSGFPQLSALSYSIKVISKPMNQRKPRKKSASGTPRRSKKITLSSSSPPSTPSSELMPTEGSNSVSNEKLEKLDLQQQQALQLLHQLLSKSNEIQSNIAALEANDGQRPLKRIKLPGSNVSGIGASNGQCNTVAGEFESAFSTMLQCYSLMSAEEKASTTRRMLRTLSVRDSEQLEELFDILRTSGLKNYGSGINSFTGFPHPFPQEPLPVPSQDTQDCYRSDLVRIDQFYNEVFF
jgi:hypothetical protein